MKKAILISIRPEWVEKILNGSKPIEIRKSMPKCDLPIDVYIYVTKGDANLYEVIRENYIYFSGAVAEPFDTQIGFNLTKEKLDRKYRDNIDNGFSDVFTKSLNGKVVAKFTLNKVEDFIVTEYGIRTDSVNSLCFIDLPKKTQLNLGELHNYINVGSNGYAWHIDNLQIFDTPMELSEFYKGNYEYIRDYVDCNNKNCPYIRYNSILGDDGDCDDYDCPRLKVNKAPQSWQYVYIGD